MSKKLIIWIIVLSLAANLIFILISLTHFFDTKKVENTSNEPFGYYSAIRGFEAQNRTAKDIVFIGDSRVAGFDFQKEMPDCQILNRGIAGDSLNGLQYRMNEILRQKPSVILLECGVNDLRNLDFDLYHQQHYVRYIVHNFERLVDTIQSKSPTTKLYINSIIPTYNGVSNCYQCNAKIDTLNKYFEKICIQKHVNYLNLNTAFKKEKQLSLEYTYDGLHLNQKGYKAWSEQLKSSILSELK